MHLSIDTSTEDLGEVVRVVGAAYGVELTVSSRPGTAEPNSGRRPKRPSSRRSAAPDPKAVRRWAGENGYEVSARGALSRAVVEAYSASR